MSQMLNIHDFKWYKKAGTLPANLDKQIQKLIKQKGNVLILGNGCHQTGATSMLKTCEEYLRSLGKVALVLPSLYTTKAPQFFRSQKWKHFKQILAFPYKTIWVFSHTHSPADFESSLTNFHPYFDMILDMRNINGHREVYRLLKKSGKGYAVIFEDITETTKHTPKTKKRAA